MKAAEVDGHIEAFAYQLGEFADADGAMRGPVVLGKIQNLGRDLAGSPWPAAPRNQGLQAAFPEGALCSHTGRYGHAEPGRSLFEGRVFLMRAYHLVADLQEVSRIEEGAAFKQGIGDRFRVRVEGSGLA